MRSKKVQPKLKDYLKSRIFILLITIAYTAVILVLLINRFWQYEVFYYDHGYTESALYQASKFQMPLWDREGRAYAFVDHFYPSALLLYSPFFWFFDSYLTTVVIFSILMGITPFIGYEIGVALKLKKFIVYALVFAFMFFIGFQNTIIFFVKDVSSSVPFLMLLFLVLVKRQKLLYFMLIFITLGFRENLAITIFALGIYIFIFEKDWRKEGLYTVIIGIFYALLVTKLIVPYFIFKSFNRPSPYMFEPDFGPSLTYLITAFFDTVQKRETIFISFLNFGFLPLIHPLGWLMAVQDFAQRFVLQGGTPLRTGLNVYYSATLSVLFFVSSLLTLQKLQRKLSDKAQYLIALFIVLTVIFLHRFVYHGPLGLIYNPDFLKITKNMTFMNEYVNKIPRTGKIMVQNNLAVRFTHDDYYILSSEKYFQKIKPDVIALDFRPGQNINNYWPMTEEKMKNLSALIKNNPDYEPVFEEEYRYIFIKN